MEDDLYHSSQEYHSITKDNSANIFKIKEEKNSNDTILMEYISHNNYVNLSQNSKSLNICVDESKCMNLVSMDNSFDNDVSTQTTKSSLILNYDQQVEMATSRRRQTFKCPYCPKIFCNSSAIAKHKLTHSDERKYVCDICSKAFKRQDHLNGHKYTHKVNKPHACHFCERSYSDARSLKRHYENQHQKEYKEKMAARDSGSSVDDNGPSVIDSFGFLDDHRSVRCEVCGRGFKNQSALNGHMRLHGGYGQTKNIITGPGEPKQNVPKCDNSVEKILPVLPKKQLNSLNRGAQNVIITTSNSESGSLIPLLPSLPNTSTNFPSQSHSSSVRLINSPNFATSPKYDPSLSSGPHGNSNNLPNVSIEDLCLVLQPSSIDKNLCDPCHTSSNSEKSSSPLEINTDGISYSQSATDHLLSNAGLPQNQYSPITPAYPAKNSNININLHDQNLFIYPSILNDHQINNQSFNEPDLSFENNQSDDYLLNYDKFNPGFVTSNSNSINKSWPFYDISLNSQETSDYNNSNSPSLKQISSSNNLQDILINFDNLSDSNEVTNNSVPSIIEQTIWPQYHDHNQNISLSNNVSKIMDQNILNNLDSAICPSAIINDDETKNNSVLKAFIPESQPANPNKKLKSRPAPIFIPPQTSAHMSRLRSPRVWNTSDSSDHKIPPYTPPPMLSPQRKGSGLFHTVRNSSLKSSLNSANSFCSWNTPFSTQAITAVSNNFCSDSIVSCMGNQQISSVIVQDYSIEKKTIEPQHFLYQDEYLDLKLHSLDDKDGLPTSATPRINIGPEYQVDLSHFYPDKHKQSYNHRDYDTLLWNPVHFKETGENISSLNLLTKIASSPAVKSCGLNMEYTFHLLFKFQGDLEKTLRALLEESLVVYDYVYAETSNWTTGEICKFQERLKAHDRDFMRVSLDLQSCGMNKSVKACVEFYYVWKHMNNTKDTDIYRRPRKKPTTRNWTHYIEEDNFPPVLDSCSAFQQMGETPYNLRRKYNSENQKLPKQMCYGSKTSSCSSSREHSPSYQKMSKNIAIVPPHENAKKSRLSYQCCYCNRTFAKSKSLENHNRTCIQNKLSKSRTQTRNIERTPESMR